MKRSMYPLIIEVECACPDCDWEGFTGDCLTEDDGDDTLECPLCRAAVEIQDDEELQVTQSGESNVSG